MKKNRRPFRPAFGFLLAVALPAVAASPIQALKARGVERPTEVLVLATQHLSRVEGLRPEHLDGLHAALLAYAPDAVVVERMDFRGIETMLARRDEYRRTLDGFVGDDFLAQAQESRDALGLDPAGARRALAECRPLPLEARERTLRCMHLAAAANDPAWLDYMAYRFGRVFREPAPLRGTLLERSPQNENHLIAARLAEALDLDRVYAMDDMLESDQLDAVLEALNPALERSADAERMMTSSELMAGMLRRQREGVAAGDLLPLYLWMNSPAFGGLVIEDEWRLFVDGDLPCLPARQRLALWDVRNLGMVARIMRVAADHPGGRVLVVVGSSHKVFFDDYLATSLGVRVRQLAEFVPAARD